MLASTAKHQISIDQKTAELLFRHVWLTSFPSVQLSIAALLSQSSDSHRWMPAFLADMLKKALSSDASGALIPKDRWASVSYVTCRFKWLMVNFLYRVFVTLLFMRFKSIQLSSSVHPFDQVLSVLNEQLSVLNSEKKNPLALSHLDLPLVNWLLLYCCCCLDKTATTMKETSKLSRNKS